MQIDFEAGRKIPVEDLIRFLIEAFAPGKAAGQRANHFLWIDTGFRSEYQRLANRGEIDRHDDLVGELRKAAGTKGTHVGYRFPECIEDRQGALEILRFPSGHDG